MRRPSGRVLAIDPGTVRIGLAVSDPLGIVAQGLPTLRSAGRKNDLESLVALVRDREIVEIVVGCPRNLDGGDGAMTAPARQLAQDLRDRTSLPVALWDERLTSAAAERAMLEGDLSREKRRDLRDRVSAILILQGFLDSRSPVGSE